MGPHWREAVTKRPMEASWEPSRGIRQRSRHWAALYPGIVQKLAALAVCLASLAAACGGSESRPTIAYRYEVRGTGEGVQVSFLVPEASLVERTVRLPWASEELQGTDETPLRIEVDGPTESRVTCIVLYRRIDGSYRGDGSGSMKQSASSDEDQTVCSLDESGIG